MFDGIHSSRPKVATCVPFAYAMFLKSFPRTFAISALCVNAGVMLKKVMLVDKRMITKNIASGFKVILISPFYLVVSVKLLFFVLLSWFLLMDILFYI